MTADKRIEQAELLYERAVFGGDSSALASADRNLDEAEADLALARGRVIHARFLEERVEDARELELFERAAELYGRLGDVRGEGEAVFWAGAFHQVVRDGTEAAVPAFRRALDLATRAGDRLTMSYALRHLGFVDHMAGRLDEARAHFEESTRLRRELAFLAGVAANLVGLAYLAAQQERRDDAAALLKGGDRTGREHRIPRCAALGGGSPQGDQLAVRRRPSGAARSSRPAHPCRDVSRGRAPLRKQPCPFWPPAAISTPL